MFRSQLTFRSLDARSGNLSAAIHWADGDDLGRRTYFQVGDGQRSKLKITKVKYKDQGLFRCRVDFVDSPTRNFRANLTLVGKYQITFEAVMCFQRKKKKFVES